MSIEQIVVLAIIQGITEFLPISSSGHLILLPHFTGWKDQGLVTDVMVHMGSLLAVIVYFWRDVLRLIGGGLDLLRGRLTPYGKLALFIIIATIPAVLFGLYLKQTGLSDQFRGNVLVVGWNAIIFGVLMLAADWWGKRTKTMDDMTLAPALFNWHCAGIVVGTGHQQVRCDDDGSTGTGVHAGGGCTVFIPARHPGDCRGWIADRARISRGR